MPFLSKEERLRFWHRFLPRKGFNGDRSEGNSCRSNVEESEMSSDCLSVKCYLAVNRDVKSIRRFVVHKRDWDNFEFWKDRVLQLFGDVINCHFNMLYLGIFLFDFPSTNCSPYFTQMTKEISLVSPPTRNCLWL